jgi:hypothetical protein
MLLNHAPQPRSLESRDIRKQFFFDSSTQNTTLFISDSSSPEIEFPPDLPKTTSTNLQVSWTSSEFAFFQCNLDGVQRISCGQGTTGDMSFRTSEGPHTFSVRGTDRYGNAGEWRQYRFDVGKEKNTLP